MIVSFSTVLLFVLIQLLSMGNGSKISFPILERRFIRSKLVAHSEKVISTAPESVRFKRCQQYSDFLQENKRWGGALAGSTLRYVNNSLFSLIYTFILRVINKCTVYRSDLLLNQVFHREKGRGLLTYSNHQSMADDPGTWAAILPWWRMHPEQFRWSLCTEDVFFAVRSFRFTASVSSITILTTSFQAPAVSAVMGAGNVIPLDRAGSIDQPLLQRFLEKVKEGKWGHIYPEGRVWQNWRFSGETEPHLGKFKAGVGKVIAHSYPNDPIVVPVFLAGFDGVIPEKILNRTDRSTPSSPRTVVPQGGNHIRIFVGNPVSFREKIKAFEKTYPTELQSWKTTRPKIALYREITEELRHCMLELEKEAYGRPSVPPKRPSRWPSCQPLE